MLDLDAIEARAAAATEGPWGVEARIGLVAVYRQFLPVEGDRINNVCETGWASDRQACRDATFIAYASTDVPALVAEDRELRARVAYLEAILGAAQKGGA